MQKSSKKNFLRLLLIFTFLWTSNMQSHDLVDLVKTKSSDVAYYALKGPFRFGFMAVAGMFGIGMGAATYEQWGKFSEAMQDDHGSWTKGKRLTKCAGYAMVSAMAFYLTHSIYHYDVDAHFEGPVG